MGYQTNELYRSMGFVEVVMEEGVRNLYSGWGWTMARNAPGSFCLFGGNALVKEYVFCLEDHRDANMLQTIISSAVGGTASIVIACPLDVVKTRVQSGHFEGISGMQIIEMLPSRRVMEVSSKV